MNQNNPKLAVLVPVYNESLNIGTLLDSLEHQTRQPDEIIVVDDGSTDDTAAIVARRSVDDPRITLIRQKNAGPAAARNNAWHHTDADICCFTDGDCIPDPHWIEEVLRCFGDQNIGAVAGTYRTANPESLLARFVGYEIAYKYRNIRGPVDFHGTYNLAIRKTILEKTGGFDEHFRTAEDADLTYRISDISIIFFTPDSVVGHFHPDSFWWYMKNQVARGKDRVMLYRAHPNRMKGDAYTGTIVKYQVLASGAFIPSLALFSPIFPYSFLVPLSLLAFMTYCALFSFPFIAKRDLLTALYGIPVQLARGIAWFIGLVQGVVILITSENKTYKH